MKKVVFAAQGLNHLSYYSYTIRALLEKGVSVHLFYDPRFTKDLDGLYQIEKQYLNFEYEEISVGFSIYFKWFIRELITYNSYVKREGQSKYFKERWLDYFPRFLTILFRMKLINKFIKSKLVIKILILTEKVFSVDKKLSNRLKNIKIDYIVASPGNMRHSTEIEFIKYAKQNRISNAILVLSWDNLSNKGLFHSFPDVFYVWNNTHKTQLKNIHNYHGKVEVVGSSLFEKWYPFIDKPYSRKNYVIYLGSSANIVDNEINNVKFVRDLLPQAVKIIFRPHPKSQVSYDNIDIAGVEVQDMVCLAETPQQEQENAAFIKNATFVVGVNTSAFLDAIVLGTPCFYILTSDTDQTQMGSTHFNDMVKKGYFKRLFRENIEYALNFKTKKEFYDLQKDLILKEIFPADSAPSQLIVDKILNADA